MMDVHSMEKSSTQEKHAYLIISDMHDYYKNKVARFNYPSELQVVKDKIFELIDYYKSLNFKVYLIFLGDIFDRSYKDVTPALQAQSFYSNLADNVEKIYSVVGNHEYTYAANNPFWSLVSEIETSRVSGHANKQWNCYGFKPCFKVVDRIKDGNVEFCFNHYGANILKPELDKISIGLFHQDLVFSSILEDAKKNNRTLFEMENKEIAKTFPHIMLDSSTNVLSGYSYCFFGHLHLLYGDWKYVDDETGKIETVLWYLGSLGRTNHREVQDTFLERTIPTVLIENGNLIQIDSNKFLLPPRSECVKEEIILNNQQKYKEVKERSEVRSYVGTSDNPVEALIDYFKLQEPSGSVSTSVINSILKDTTDEFLDYLRGEFYKII